MQLLGWSSVIPSKHHPKSYSHKPHHFPFLTAKKEKKNEAQNKNKFQQRKPKTEKKLRSGNLRTEATPLLSFNHKYINSCNP